jgi:hypothetical protein
LLKNLEENDIFSSNLNPEFKGYVIKHSPMGTKVQFISCPDYAETNDDNSPLKLKEFYLRKPMLIGSDMEVNKINLEKEK